MARARAGGRWRAVGVAALASALGIACSLVTNTNGLTGGDGDAGAAIPDTGAVATEDSQGVVTPSEDTGAPLVDAGSEAATGPGEDSSAPVDAATDGPYCASLVPPPLFCDDFDELPLTTPWDQVTHTGATAVLGTGIVVSPPYAMLVTTEADQATVDCSGYKSFLDASTTGTYTLAFDIYVAQADETASSDSVLSAFELVDPSGSRWAAQLELSYTATDGGQTLAVNFSENGTPHDGGRSLYTSHPVATPLAIGVWTRVTMRITVTDADGPGSTGNTASLELGDAAATKVTESVATINGTPEILVGATYAQDSTQGWTVRYDNVTLSVE